MQIQGLNKDKTKLVILTSDKFVLYDVIQQQIVNHLKSKKKENVPHIIDLSSDDKYSIEINSDFPTTILMRNLIKNTIVAKFEGHS